MSGIFDASHDGNAGSRQRPGPAVGVPVHDALVQDPCQMGWQTTVTHGRPQLIRTHANPGSARWQASLKRPPKQRVGQARLGQRRAISGPLAKVRSGQPGLLRSTKVSSSAALTAVRHAPSKLVLPSSSLLDCPGQDSRVKAKPHAVASRALTRQPRPEDGSNRGGRRRTSTRPSAQAGPRSAVPLARH
jgi:hypothetical protein